jgi:hypothetical protein
MYIYIYHCAMHTGTIAMADLSSLILTDCTFADSGGQRDGGIFYAQDHGGVCVCVQCAMCVCGRMDV